MKTFASRACAPAILGFMAILTGAGTSAAAVTFGITPSAISNTYVGPITLQIGGLTNGEAVVVDQYADINANGLIDTNDGLVGSFRLVDGQQATIGGITNVNVPCDLTGTNGAITAVLMYAKPRAQYPSGQHLFRLSSPAGNWTAKTNTFAITNWPFPQTISGTVTASSTNVPGAFVGFRSSGGDFVPGPFTDSLGNYSFRLPPGAYQPLVGKPGYVFNSGTAPLITLANSNSVTTNLALIPATTSISGRVADSANTNLGPAGIFMFWQSAGSRFAFATTATNGVFNVPVTSDVWQLQLVEGSCLFNQGYLHITGSAGALLTYDSTTGKVSTVFIPVQKGNAMFYGRITNSVGVPVPGVEFSGAPNGSSTNIYRGSGISDTNGNYTALAVTGDCAVNLNTPGPAAYVISSGGNATLASNQAARVDFLALAPTGIIRGGITNNTGGPIAQLSVNANTSVGSFGFQSRAVTDANGNYSMPVFNGSWCVQPNCNNSNDGLNGQGYNCVPPQCPNVSSTNTIVNFTAYPFGSAVLSDPGWLGPNQFGFWLSAVSGYNYYVQYSKNLADANGWITVLTTNLPMSSIFIEDNQATNQQRFYRALRF